MDPRSLPPIFTRPNIIPPGYISIEDAIHTVGRTSFSDTWTGLEVAAGLPVCTWDASVAAFVDCLPISDEEKAAIVPRYDRDDHNERRVDANSRLLQLLYGGSTGAIVFRPDGTTKALASRVWAASTGGVPILESGWLDLVTEAGHRYRTYPVIHRASLEAALGASPPSSTVEAPSIGQTTDGEVKAFLSEIKTWPQPPGQKAALDLFRINTGKSYNQAAFNAAHKEIVGAQPKGRRQRLNKLHG